jgi:3-oxoacyl-[acyl-carrier protein] reductase
VLGDGGAAVAVRADVKDELDVERLFEESRSAFGGVDVVVIAIVGAIPRRSISDVTLGELDGLWRHTTRATFTVMREAVRHIRDGGSIVSLTSVLVTRPRATYGAYVAALSGTDMVTRVAALEFADRDITVNAVAFGVDVPCEPDPIADTVEYLVSPEGHAITGQVIRVNGPVWGGHEPGTNGSAHKEDAF